MKDKDLVLPEGFENPTGFSNPLPPLGVFYGRFKPRTPYPPMGGRVHRRFKTKEGFRLEVRGFRNFKPRGMNLYKISPEGEDFNHPEFPEPYPLPPYGGFWG